MILPLLLLVAAEPGYIDAARCAGCHDGIARRFAASGMGRAFDSAPKPREGTYYHRASNRHYRVYRRDSGYWMRRHQVDGAGHEVNVVERRIDYAIGSGNHAVTYVHRTGADRLIELPVSWYAADGGHWAMSPGYDRPDHFDFRREVTADCLFCHNGYPSETSAPEANGGLARGIDCQRCHGPGEAHARTPRRGNIVNPALLSFERRREVCLQCHLETASQGIADSIRAPGRAVNSYRPGEPLAEYKVYFDHAPGPEREAKFDINHAGYGMLLSRCRPLECTTCHDPHSAQAKGNSACQGCHTAGDHARAETDCISCHMPKRRATDAVHVVMTDHRIRRRRPENPLTPLRESTRAYQGPLAAFYPAVAPPLVLAWAQVKEGNDRTGGLAAFADAVRRHARGSAEWLERLGDAYRSAGNWTAAEGAYRDAVKRAADSRVRGSLGEALLRQGRAQEALGHLEKSRHRLALGVAYGQLDRLADSERVLREAVRDNPDDPLAWLNLGVTLEQVGQRKAARDAYREAIRIQPDSSEARHRLAVLESRR